MFAFSESAFDCHRGYWLNTRMDTISPADLLDIAVCAAETAGRHAMDNQARRSEISESFDHDIKLVLDMECQQAAEQVIASAFPNHAILGEEQTRPSQTSAYEWIIDPIDGTVNFFRGLPYWCCSVAVRRHDEILAGCVYAPELSLFYTAVIDGPALCNGEPVRTSTADRLDEAIVLTGLSKHMETDGHVHFDRFRKLALNTRKLRINGSAALDLCYVAAGIADGFFEPGIYLWDFAAAGLIARQAGAVLQLYPEPEEPHRYTVLCTNEQLIDSLCAIHTQCTQRG